VMGEDGGHGGGAIKEGAAGLVGGRMDEGEE
jgi:hypothetical protein